MIYPYEMYNYSNIRVAKADFLKLKLVSLSYNFPKKMLQPLNVNSLMLRFQVTNLFTIADKKWTGSGNKWSQYSCFTDVQFRSKCIILTSNS